MKGKMILREVAEWVITFAGAFVIVMLLNTKVFATTQVRQSSMQNTLFEGQHLFVEKLSYDFGNPSKGDIVVFIENQQPKDYFDEVRVFLTDISEVFKPIDQKTDVRLVKRIIAVPGDTVDIKDGSVYVNGEKLTEPYTTGPTETREFQFPVKVPDGKYIVMGDNRGVSMDSRSFGFIDRCQVEGKAVARFWPLSKLGVLK